MKTDVLFQITMVSWNVSSNDMCMYSIKKTEIAIYTVQFDSWCDNGVCIYICDLYHCD